MTRSRPDDAGPSEPDFPTCCPNCGDENVGVDDELLDESYLTCGKEQCIEAQKKREAQDREAERLAAEERCYAEQWERELSEKDPEQ